jgi:hypothetical protein
VDGRDGGGWIRGRLLDSAGVPAGPSFPLVQAVGEVARLEVAGSREGEDYRRDFVLLWQETGGIRALLFRIEE